MHYVLGGFIVLFLLMILPLKAILAISVIFIVSALIIQTSASFATQTKIPFSKSLKASIYSLLLSVLALSIVAMTSGPSVFIAPLFLFIVQAYAYSISLEVPLLGSAIISVIVMVVGWLALTVFGLSLTTTLKMIT